MSNAGKVVRLPARVREGVMVCLSSGSGGQRIFQSAKMLRAI